MKRKNSLSNTQGRGHHITAFYIETLALTVIFIVVILVLMKVFATAERISSQAKVLTCAVRLAENAAEAVAASDSEETLYALLDESGMGNVTTLETVDTVLFQTMYDGEMNPSAEGSFQVGVTWEPQDGRKLVKSSITVYWNGEEIYALDTAVYIGQ